MVRETIFFWKKWIMALFLIAIFKHLANPSKFWQIVGWGAELARKLDSIAGKSSPAWTELGTRTSFLLCFSWLYYQFKLVFYKIEMVANNMRLNLCFNFALLHWCIFVWTLFSTFKLVIGPDHCYSFRHLHLTLIYNGWTAQL
jgi:hypothetical protein